MPDDSLFSREGPSMEPLAARMRPQTLDEFVGQEHILGPGRLLRRAIQADMLSSLIFYGPPGTGKTTLARVIANTTRSSFISLNAVLAGVKDIREAIAAAKENVELYDRRTILFVDEVHRWNKSQQDALLPWVENGTVIFIGATTHNPYFEVNSALVSRSRIFQLTALTDDDLRDIALRTLSDPVRGYGSIDVQLAPDALEHLVAVAAGDARALLGALQLAVETTVPEFPPPPGTSVTIDRGIAEDSIQQKAVLYDKEGDYHFDVISAFIKSIRGSDPDATLYWLARMVAGGEDPRYIFRRLLIAAGEDVGLADPHAVGVVESDAAAFDRVGLPEGRFHLAHAALYLATCPKSNSALGFFDALRAVEAEQQADVPTHLRDASRDKEGFGHGEGYLYPHAYAEHWVAQAYLPEELQGRLFYQPSSQGYEAGVRERVERLRELQLEVGLPEAPEEVLTYSRTGDRALARWLARSEAGRARGLAELREAAVTAARVARHHRVLVAGRLATLALWEAVRAAPEGRVVGLIADPARYAAALRHVGALDALVRPLLLDAGEFGLAELVTATGSTVQEAEGHSSITAELSGLAFERIILADGFALAGTTDELFRELHAVSAPGGTLVIVQRLPQHGQRISSLLERSDGEDAVGRSLAEAEERLFTTGDRQMLHWDEETVTHSLTGAGWTVTRTETRDVNTPRPVTREHVEEWISPDRTEGLGVTLRETAGDEMREKVRALLLAHLSGKTVNWRVRFLISVAERARE
jgi:putative ATPase